MLTTGIPVHCIYSAGAILIFASLCRLSQALVSTNVDYLDILEEGQSGQLPSQPLAGAVLARLGIPQQWQHPQVRYILPLRIINAKG